MKTLDTAAESPGREGRNQVGVHLDIDALRVVEVLHGRIKAWRSVPYPRGLQPVSPEFPAFLKQSMDAWPGIRHAPVWVVGTLPSLQVRFLSLPKVRPRQVSSLVYWTFRKEIPFDAAQVTFDYDIEGEDAAPGSARKLDVTAYTVAHAEVEQLASIFAQSGLHLGGVMIPSFAMRTLFRSVAHPPDEVVLGLYVGEDASSIMFVKGRRVVAHRVFKTGMNVMLDVLRDRHPSWSAADAFAAMARALPDPAGGAGEGGEEAARISETVHAAFGRLVQQVERSISAYLVGRNEEEIKSLQVAGSLARLPALVAEVGSRLGLNAQPLPAFAGRLQPGAEVAPAGDQGEMALALGAALADPAHAPNLLHTYVKREHEERMARTRRLLGFLGLAALVLLLAAHVMIGRFNRGLREQLQFQQEQIAKFAPQPDQVMILGLVQRAAVDSARLKGMAQRCLPMAVLNQLANTTPADIRLESVEMAPTKPAVGGGMYLDLQGVVSGVSGLQQSKLASYILRLEDAELFRRVQLTRCEEGREDAGPVLMIGLRMEVEDGAESLPGKGSGAVKRKAVSEGGRP